MGMMLCLLGWLLYVINNGVLDEPDPVATGMSIGFFISAIAVSMYKLFEYDQNFQNFS